MLSTFALAVKARIPIINISTEDIMFLDQLFKATLPDGPKPKKITVTDLANEQTLAPVNYLSETSSEKMENTLVTAHKTLKSAGVTLILVNMRKPSPCVLDVGVVTPPKEYLVNIVAEAIKDPVKAKSIVQALGGCGIKETASYIGLTSARDASVTVEGVKSTRKTFFNGTKGLTNINTDQKFYWPDPKFDEFSKAEKMFFLESDESRLRPRGVLLDGKPGTGKTEGAKWLSRQWGVPLFRLDVAGTQNKYVGESERFLQEALSRVETQEPCILLVDEVEKVMSSKGNDSSGVKSNMLSQLLWWLQEHNSRVLTIMTTNDKSKIPPELIRQGRIDRQMYIGGLDELQSMEFLEGISDTFDLPGIDTDKDRKMFLELVYKNAASPDETDVAQATLVTKLKEGVKVLTLNQLKTP